MSRINSATTPLLSPLMLFTATGLLILTLLAAYLSMPAQAAVSSQFASKTSLSAADIERARNYFTDTELTTHDGRQVRFYSDMLDDRIVMINVMYTNCIGACPLTTQKLSQASRELGDLYGSKIQYVSITNDPERDTPEALTEFAKKQGVNLDGWTFLTGSKENIDKVIKKMGLYTPKIEQHKAQILIGNTSTGRWQKVKPNIPYQAIAAKLKELAGGF